MTGIKQMYLGVWQIPPEGLSCGSRKADPPGSRAGQALKGERIRRSRCPDCNARDARCRAYDAVRLLRMTRTYRTLQDAPLDRTNTVRCPPTWRPGLPDRHWRSE